MKPTILTGFANPDGTLEGNWAERIDPCNVCGQPSHRIDGMRVDAPGVSKEAPIYQAHRNDVEGSAFIEVVLGVLILSMFVVGLMAWSWIGSAVAR